MENLNSDKVSKQELTDAILELYPTARPKFIEIVLDAIEIHAKKNNDYNGGGSVDIFYNMFGLNGRFYDIWRKVQRLHSIIISKTKVMVKESAIDTAKDLGNYAFLLAEDIERYSYNTNTTAPNIKVTIKNL